MKRLPAANAPCSHGHTLSIKEGHQLAPSRPVMPPERHRVYCVVRREFTVQRGYRHFSSPVIASELSEDLHGW